ncbi:MAG: Arm DNA-binding domain-containing protein, partial [Comamonas sp.]
MHFDPRAAKLLKSGEHLLVIACQGLRLEGSVNRKSWTYRYKDAAGKMKQVKLGEWPTMGLGQATSVWQELRDKRGAGIDPVALKKEQAAGSSGVAVATVAQLVARFCDLGCCRFQRHLVKVEDETG